METQAGLFIAVAEFDELQGSPAERTLDLLKQSAVPASIDFDDSWSLSRASAGPPESDLKQFLQSHFRGPRAGPVILYLYGRMTLSGADVVITTSLIAYPPERQSAVSVSHLLNLLKHVQSSVVCLVLEVVVEPDSLANLETRLNNLLGDLKPDAFGIVAPNPSDISQKVEFLPLAWCLAQALREDSFSPERAPESGPDSVEAIWRIRTSNSSLWRWPKPYQKSVARVQPVIDLTEGLPLRDVEVLAPELPLETALIQRGGTGTLWYGTNRRPVNPSEPARGYSSERDDRINYGRCKVYVPERHNIGSLGSHWLKRLIFGDDRLKLTSIEALQETAYWAGVRDVLSTLPPGRNDILIFLHGYNVSFEEAALRAAQISCDLNFPGVTAFFSWPSRGKLGALAYHADEATIEVSENYVAEFLVACAANSGANRIHVIAHSMGNRGLLRAMNSVVHEVSWKTGARFGHFILAAPDVDEGYFRKHAVVYPGVTQRTTLYVSDKDLALASSGIMHGHARAGFVPPVTVLPDMDTVFVAKLDLTFLGHGYVGSARGVLTDMHELLFFNAPPWRRSFAESKTEQEKRYWAIL